MNKPRLQHQGRELPLAPSVSDEVTALDESVMCHISNRTHGAIRDLCVKAQGSTLVIRGKCDRYYDKQLAQAAVKTLPGGPWEVQNEINVVNAPKRP